MMNYLHYMFIHVNTCCASYITLRDAGGGGDHLKKQGSIRRKPPSREWVDEMKKAADGCM